MSEDTDYISFDRQKLYDLMWSIPIKEICLKYYISNNELRYSCKNREVPIPRDSYWTRSEKNKDTFKTPLDSNSKHYNGLLRLRLRKEDDPYITQEQDFKDFVEQIENDDRINIQVPERLLKPHAIINRYKQFIDETRKKDNYTSMFYSRPLNIRVGEKCLNRAILIADTIIKALEGRGHKFSLRNDVYMLSVNGIDFEFKISERSKVAEERTSYDSRILIPTGFLSIEFGPGYNKSTVSDTETTKLENKIPFILAKIELMAKHEVWEKKERSIQQAIYEEQRQKQLEIQRLKEEQIELCKKLLENSERWNKANHLRSYIKAYENKLTSENKEPEEILTWTKWAQEIADWYDPLIEKPIDLLVEIDRNTLEKNKFRS